MTEQELREKIDEFIWAILSFGMECSDEWVANQKIEGRPFINHRRKYLFDLIKEAGYVRLAKDQSLPDTAYRITKEYMNDLEAQYVVEHVKKAQQDMLKAGLQKIEQGNL